MFLTLLLFLYFFSSFFQEDALIPKLWAVITIALLFLALRVILWRFEEGIELGAYHIKNNSWLGKLQIAWVLNFFAPLFLSRFLIERKKWISFLYAVIYFLCGAAVFLLFSRAGSAAFVLTTLMLLIFELKRWKKWLPLVVVSSLFLLPVVIKTATISSYIFHSTINFRQEPGMVRRAGIWKETMRMFTDQPLTGIGLGTYDEIAYSRYHTKYDEVSGVKDWFYRSGWHAHNMLLHILAETGLLGFLAWLYLWYTILLSLLKKRKGSNSVLIRSNIASILCSIFAFFVLSISENPMAVRVHESLRMNLTLWFLILYGLYNLNAIEKNERAA